MAWIHRLWPYLAALSLCAAAGQTARAQGFDAERFAPATGAASDLAVESPVVPFHLGFGLGLFVNYADNPLVERDLGTDEIVSRPIDRALSADLVASLGLFDFFELGAHLPVHMIYEGDDLAAGGGAVAASEGIGDLRLVPKATIWGAGDAGHHVVFGFGLPVSLPTGDDAGLRGAGGVTVEPRFLALWQLGELGVTANVGYRYRAEKPEALPVGDQITTALSLTYGLVPETLALHGEVLGGFEVNTDADGPTVPLEALGGIIWTPHPAVRVYAAGGPGLAEGLGAPDFRVLAGIRITGGVPERHGFGDTDGDGIADRDDACPEDPEDEDGFVDGDGCPERDNDRDGILDNDDRCPELPEERGGDGDGCPSETYVEVRDGQLVIFGKVLFKTGSAEIEKGSEPLVDQIAVALRANPDVGRVRIEGHTDDVGDNALNQRLSEERAASVKAALVSRGVSEDRLETRGYGESRPIAPNKTRAGRAKNRRVEFVIVNE